MRIDPSSYEELRKIQRGDLKRKTETPRETANDAEGAQGAVADENNKAFIATLSNKDFETNFGKIEKLRNDIKDGKYQPSAENIAKRIVQSEQRGDINLGLFTT
ncbi:MAG: flagellar biosynthesis anti-sigma factor FlgM [Candidatus Margulisiibacteriota bacterium]